MIKFIIHSLYLGSAVTALAMDSGGSQAAFTTGGNTLQGIATFAWQDIDAVLEIDLNRDGQLDASELEASNQFLSEYGETLYHFKQGEQTLESTSASHTWDAEAGTIQFHYTCQAEFQLDASNLTAEFTGHRDFPVGHQQQIEVTDSSGNVASTRRIGDPSARPLFPLPAPVPKPAAVAASVPEATSLGRLSMTFLTGTLFLVALCVSIRFIRHTSIPR